ncbi:hypothetical protein D3C81_2202180 [compost metagenome]
MQVFFSRIVPLKDKTVCQEFPNILIAVVQIGSRLIRQFINQGLQLYRFQIRIARQQKIAQIFPD